MDDHVTFVGTDFHPTTSEINFVSSGTNIYCTAGSSTCSFIAPLYLPQGSQITEIDYYVVDNNSNYDLAMQVNRFNPQTGNLSFLGVGSTIGYTSSDDILTITKTGSPLFTIDNTTQDYVVLIQPTMTSMEQRIVGARVHYTPGVAKNFQVHTFAGYDFQANISKVEYGTLGGAIFPEEGGSAGPFTANLDLPDGDVIYKLTFYYKKLTGTSGNLTLAVKSYHPGEGTGNVLQSYNTNAIPAGDSLNQLSFVGTVATLGKMDTQAINLWLVVTPSAADEHLILYGAQVQFFFPSENFVAFIQQ